MTSSAPSQNYEKRLLASSCLSVCLSAWNNSAPTERILWNFIFKDFLKICRENSSFLKPDKHNGYFTWKPMYIYNNVSLIFLRMRNISDNSSKENQNTNCMLNNIFPRIVPFMTQCGKIWYSQTGHRCQYNTRRKKMRFARRIIKARIWVSDGLRSTYRIIR